MILISYNKYVTLQPKQANHANHPSDSKAFQQASKEAEGETRATISPDVLCSGTAC